MIRYHARELLPADLRRELIEEARPHLTPSLVQYGPNRRPNQGLRISHNYRFRVDTEASLRVREIAAELTGAELSQAEPIDVVRYGPGGFFGDHHDGISRLWTVCFSLTDEHAGGELIFPKLREIYTPAAGEAVVWPNTTMETVHRSERIHEGEKWVAVVWLRPE